LFASSVSRILARVAVCPACGRDNPEGFQFCGFCASPLAPGDGREVRKTVTVLFSDVTGSTELGELLDPESLRDVLARYFDLARTVVQRHGGTVEKFIGDAVMAVFGVPAAHEDDAIRAVRAASEIRANLAALNDELERTSGVRLETRTGVNSGEVVAGDPSSGQSFVSGDTVNVAARLEQAAQPGEILIGAGTLSLVRDAVRVEATEPLPLKGKAEPVPAFRLLEVLAGAPAHARRLDSPMVGRDDELQQVLDAFERVEGGHSCELVTVVGEAGVGKSRLTTEVLSRLAGRATVLEGRSLPYGEGITFWALAEMVRQAAGIGDADPPAGAFARIDELLDGVDDAALVRDRVGAAIGLGDATGAIQETYWAARRLLESLAAERPVVAVFDDIHWAEPTLLDLLEYVAGFSRNHSVFLLCMARPELREIRPEWDRAGTVVTLPPLDHASSDDLIANLVGFAHLPSEIRDRIVEAAEGNPLFVEEMLRSLIDDGVLRRDDGSWVVTADLARLQAPGTIQALISARLDRLQDEERAVIQRASVVGQVFFWGAVTELSPDDARRAVGANLQMLQRKELIRPEASSFAGQDAFRFSHLLVRDAAYESIPKRTPGGPAPALRLVAGASRRRSGGGIRGDRRLPPGTGPPVRDRARPVRRPVPCAGGEGELAAREIRPGRARSKRRAGGAQPPVTGDRARPRGFPGPPGAAGRSRIGARAVGSLRRRGRAAGRSRRVGDRRGRPPREVPRRDPEGGAQPAPVVVFIRDPPRRAPVDAPGPG
jgi:class 3 adenylate cyclase